MTLKRARSRISKHKQHRQDIPIPQGLRLGHSNNPNIVIKKNNATYTIKNNQVKSVATVSSNPPSFNVLDRNTADMSAGERAVFDNRPVFDKANEIYDNAGIPRANADGFIPGFGSIYRDLPSPHSEAGRYESGWHGTPSKPHTERKFKPPWEI